MTIAPPQQSLWTNKHHSNHRSSQLISFHSTPPTGGVESTSWNSVCLFVCLSVRLSICLSICLSFCLSVCLVVVVAYSILLSAPDPLVLIGTWFGLGLGVFGTKSLGPKLDHIIMIQCWTGVFWIGEFISTAIGIEKCDIRGCSKANCYIQLVLDIPNLLAVLKFTTSLYLSSLSLNIW